MVRSACLVLLVCAAAGFAGEPVAEPATLRLPADTRLVVRFASLDRLDAIGKELQSLFDALGAPGTLSEMVAGEFTKHGLPIDRTRPFYIARGEAHGVVWLFHADRGAPPGGGRIPLPRERSAHHVGELLLVADRDLHDAPKRSAPFAVVSGDVSVAFDVGPLIREHRALLHDARGSIDELERQDRFPLPAGVFDLMRVLSGLLLDAVDGFDQFHYALTLRGARLESEGWIRTRPRSVLHTFLSEAPPAKPSGLMGYLPRDALLMVDSNGLASWLDGAAERALDRGLGAGSGHALLVLLSPSYALGGHLTGRAAGTVKLLGIMGGSMRAIFEVKPGAPIEKAIAGLDEKAINATLEKIELPVRVQIRHGVAKHGATPIHRLAVSTSLPQFAMLLSQMETRFAVENGHLFVTQSPTPETDLKSLIDRVRRGEPKEHPHVHAMQRLMPEGRHEGLTINLGGLKAVLALLLPFPKAGPAIRAFPDDLFLSTAIAVRDGHVHLRGDWPLIELVRVVDALAGR